jgi:hypothetical protein
MHLLLTNGIHSDITLIVDGISYRLHKFILSARSPYFEGMFNRGFKESTADVVEHKTKIPPLAFKVIFSLLPKKLIFFFRVFFVFCTHQN